MIDREKNQAPNVYSCARYKANATVGEPFHSDFGATNGHYQFPSPISNDGKAAIMKFIAPSMSDFKDILTSPKVASEKYAVVVGRERVDVAELGWAARLVPMWGELAAPACAVGQAIASPPPPNPHEYQKIPVVLSTPLWTWHRLR